MIITIIKYGCFTTVVASEGCDTTVIINISPLEDGIPFNIMSHIYPNDLHQSDYHSSIDLGLPRKISSARS